MVRIERVSKFYDDKAAVGGMDLEVPSGSLFGLIGPNGAGKTTTLKMLATLIKPDEGRISVEGLDCLTDVRRVRRIVGYMPDTFGTFRGLSCDEYLRFFGRCYGLDGSVLDRRLEDVLDLTELQGLRDEPTQALSTGMRQRLALAKTLLHDPSVLLLDEPASGLDPRARIEIRSLLKELARMGKTILISSHILADLEEICTDIAIMEQGAVVWSGKLQSVLEAEREGLFQATVRVREEDVERVLRLVREQEFISSARADGNGDVVAELSGPHANHLLRALLDAGIDVIAFAREKTTLETVFLERTRGIVS